MKKIILAIMLFGSGNVFSSAMKIGSGDICGVDEFKKAQGSTACICEVMKETPELSGEYPYYKLGCGKWLNAQQCDYRITVDIDDNVDNFLGQIKDLANIKMGYVGHWASAAMTVRHAEERIVPLVKKYNVQTYYDNTACSGANDPIYIRNYIQSLPKNIKDKIIIRANQNTSVGEWDSLLSPFITSNAEITMCSDGLQIPKCSSFERKGCSIRMNNNDDVGCIDSKNQFRVFKCVDRGSRTHKNFELGDWKEVDISDQGSEILELKLSEIDRTVEVLVEASSEPIHTNEYDINGNLQVLDETYTLTEKKLLRIPVSTMLGDKSLLNDYVLAEFGTIQGDIDTGHVSPSRFEMRPMRFRIEDISKEKTVYVFKKKNANIKVRASYDREKLHQLAKKYNPIMEYYRMYTTDEENSLNHLIENLE